MKILVVVFSLCVASTLGGLSDEQRSKLNSYKEACIAETGVDPAVVENALRGQIAESDEQLQCFAACLLKKIGIMDAEGNIREEVARAKAPADIPQDKIDDVVNRCKVLTGSNACQTAAVVSKCFLETKTFNIL